MADAAGRIDRSRCRRHDRGGRQAPGRSRGDGSAMARVLFDLERPTVGLLNIGVEEVKGLEEVREAGLILRQTRRPDLDYVGFVEGDDIGKGAVDVVVTEGFAGNIALKTAEGTAKQLGEYLRSAMNRTLSARIGFLFARKAFAAVW